MKFDSSSPKLWGGTKRRGVVWDDGGEGTINEPAGPKINRTSTMNEISMPPKFGSRLRIACSSGSVMR